MGGEEAVVCCVVLCSEEQACAARFLMHGKQVDRQQGDRQTGILIMPAAGEDHQRRPAARRARTHHPLLPALLHTRAGMGMGRHARGGDGRIDTGAGGAPVLTHVCARTQSIK